MESSRPESRQAGYMYSIRIESAGIIHLWKGQASKQPQAVSQRAADQIKMPKAEDMLDLPVRCRETSVNLTCTLETFLLYPVQLSTSYM